MRQTDKEIMGKKTDKSKDDIIKNDILHHYNNNGFIDKVNNVNTGNSNQNQNEIDSRYKYLDHMTDLIVEAYGNNIAECFENSAIASLNAMFDISKVEPKNKVKIVAQGFDLKNLLYNWLEKILLVIYIDRIVINHFEYIRVKRILESNKNQILKEEIISVTPYDRNDETNSYKNILLNLDSKNKYETYEIEAIGIGEIANILKHDYKVEVKSITYHEMEIEFDQNKRFRFKFILDL